jgi:hypothetical protein
VIQAVDSRPSKYCSFYNIECLVLYSTFCETIKFNLQEARS